MHVARVPGAGGDQLMKRSLVAVTAVLALAGSNFSAQAQQSVEAF